MLRQKYRQGPARLRSIFLGVRTEKAVETEATRTLVRKLFAAYAGGDAEAFAVLLHPDIEWAIHVPIGLFSFAGPRHRKTEAIAAVAEIACQYVLKRYVIENPRRRRRSYCNDLKRRFPAAGDGPHAHVRLADFLRFEILIEFVSFPTRSMSPSRRSAADSTCAWAGSAPLDHA